MPFLISQPFVEARALLDLADDADTKAIRRAYRKAVAAHPPDRDPERFRQVRQAYELLTNPMKRAAGLLDCPVTHAPPPPLPATQAVEREPPIENTLLRAIAGQLPVSALLGKEKQP